MPALDGRTVVITRAAHQSEGFVRLLEAEGARVVRFPVIAIAPPLDWAPADDAIGHLHQYDWLLFTSANAVDAFFDRAGDAFLYGRIAAIGPATAEALRRRNRPVDLMPDVHIAEGLLDAFAGWDVNRLHILLPRAASARDVLPKRLEERGAAVDLVDVYRNVLPEPTGDFPAAVDWVTFTSASTVKNLLALAPRERWASAKLASIGPETSAALRKHQLPVTVEASPSTQEALAAAITLWENSQQ